MRLDSKTLAAPDVLRVALVVPVLENIGRDGAAAIHELRGDVVPTGTKLGLVAALEEASHVTAVLSEHALVVRLRVCCFREPPNVLDGVFDTNAANVHPLRGAWQLCGVVPEALLREVEAF